MTLVEMCVHMDCPGCEKKVRKAVERLEGVHDVEIDMAQQKVTVNGDAEQKKVLKAVRRTGLRAVLWPVPFAAGGAAAGEMHVLAQQQQQMSQLLPGGGSGSRHHHGAGPTSMYNYYKHGYDDSRMYCVSSAVAGGTRTTDYFSDENAQGCAVM